MQAELVCDLGGVHGIGQVLSENGDGQRDLGALGHRRRRQERLRKYLFIGKDQEDGIPQLVLGQHPHQLLARFIHSFPVIAVHHKD